MLSDLKIEDGEPGEGPRLEQLVFAAADTDIPAQVGATQCFRPTVLYTDVDGQCDKLVTETVTNLPCTLTVQPS